MSWLGTKTFTELSKYSFNDLSRVNENAEFIESLLNHLGISFTLPRTVKKDYNRRDFPYVERINNIKLNVIAILDAVPGLADELKSVGPVTGTFRAGEDVMVTNPALAPTVIVRTEMIQTFDYSDANSIELNLKLVFDRLIEQANNFPFCGTFYSGEEGLI